MAGLEGLTSIIYHERQQSSSALCAQHALNNLLQGSYFSAPDLSDLARNLDLLEQSYRRDEQSTSMNMDDTGFFSVQVMENALKVWGLNLVRWRSEEMWPYHDQPHTQLAFILNLEQHWFTLRRFGNAERSIDRDQGNGHWFNVDSLLPSPDWVGKVYLGMVIEQAEADGYSVFAVVQSDPNAPLALPRTEADVIAATLPEPTGVSSPSAIQSPPVDRDEADFDEEDFELQAALQASLAGNEDNSAHTTLDPDPNDTRGFTLSPSNSGNVDPVAASVERNRLMLQRMREQQEFAQREALNYVADGMSPEEIAAQEARRAARRRQEEEEEENLRRAIAESHAMAHQNGRTNEESIPSTSNAFHDDDDAEFQAALRASLEQGTLASDAEQAVDLHCRLSSEPRQNSPPALDPPSSNEPDLEEIRRRRLAKFSL
ncbi:Josephin domain containing protein [Amanita muscaria]